MKQIKQVWALAQANLGENYETNKTSMGISTS